MTPNIRLVPLALCGKFGGGGGAPPPDPPTFAPDDVTGLVRWHETAVGYLADGDGVYEFTDNSVSGAHFTQATGSKKPDVVADHFGVGIDGIQGDDIDDYMSAATLVFADDFSMFFVVSLQPDIDGHLYQNDSRGFRAISNEKLKWDFGGGSQLDLTVAASWVSGADVLFDIHRDTSDNLTAYVDSVDKTAGSPNDTRATDFLTIFSRSPFSIFNSNIYGAVIAYDNKVSDEDRDSLRTYLTSGYLS